MTSAMARSGVLSGAENEREDAARTFTCPCCDAGPGERCGAQSASHTARYNLAADAGLVPAIRPVPSMEVWCECH